MLGTAIICVVLLPVVYVLFQYLRHVVSLRLYPPGPFPWPVVGNLNLLKHKPFYLASGDLSKIYGDVVSMSFGFKRIVIINNIDIAREALITKGDLFTGRMQDHPLLYQVTRGCLDLAMSEGKRWVLLRKLAHSSFKTYGYGMDRIQQLISTESFHLNKSLKELHGAPVDPEEHLGLAFLNVIGVLLFGKRYELENPEFRKILTYLHLVDEMVATRDVGMFFPFLARFFKFRSHELLRKVKEIRDPMLDGKVAQHKATFDPENADDFTDHLIQYSEEMMLTDQVARQYIDDDSLAMIMHDFLAGGIDTGLNTIGFAIRYLIHRLDIQNAVVQEMSKTLGEGTYPTLADRPNLHVLEAVIHETLRLSTVAPTGISHKALKDTTLAGLPIPKGAVVVINHWAIHHDHRFWENPDEFDPYRWLNDSGEFVVGSKSSFLPFGAGRRNCVGETLAKAEQFLLLGRLMIDFVFDVENRSVLPPLEAVRGFILRPISYRIKFIERRNSDKF